MNFSAEQLAQLVASAVAASAAQPVGKGRGKGKAKSQPRQKLTDEQKAANALVNADVAVKLFQEAGYENCVAHETIRTYDKWIEAGRRVMKGQKALRTPKGMALFHLAQTESLTKVN
jgi:homoserine dehydrogenase